MRCPTCGTDNEPDSRFCGGCGARTTGIASSPPPIEAPRLAPTHKIADDARWDRQPASPSKPVSPKPPGYLSQPPQMPPPALGSSPPGMPSTMAGAPMPAPRPSQPQARQIVERATTDQPVRPSIPGVPPVRPSLPPPDASLAAPRRGRGLMIAVLLIDLALAGVGGALLVQGLRFRANVERVDDHH